MAPTLTVLGDCAVLLHFRAALNFRTASHSGAALRFDVPAGFNAHAVHDEDDDEHVAACVQGYTARLQECRYPWIVDCVPAYDTLCVHYDPIVLSRAGVAVLQWFESLIALPYGCAERNQARAHRIPVCYAFPHGEDLPWVAQTLGLSEAEVITLHLGGRYRVAMVGFAPGFPYLVGLPPALRLPRRSTPRSGVPAGSVAIAELQCGIYPRRLPGGWHLLGRTPLRLFDPENASPCLLQAGDAVEFYAISAAEFEVFGQC